MSPRRRIIPIFVPHAGCPNDCVFCNQKRISGSLFPASAQTVRDALEPLSSRAGYELAFYGGSFTAIPASEQEALLSAAQPWRENGAITAMRVSTRPDCVNEDSLARLKRYGVTTVELGAQSMSDEVLRRSGRGHTSADTVKASELVREAGLSLILQMMTGLPGATPERDRDTARALIALKPEGVRIYPTVVVRDTALEELYRAGKYAEHTVEDAVSLCADILPLFEKAGIPVIRLGLNPTEELSGGAAVAGAYHPALGELVRSEIILRQMRAYAESYSPEADLVFEVSARTLSSAVGQKKQNLLALSAERAPAAVRILAGNVPDGEIFVHEAAKKP